MKKIFLLVIFGYVLIYANDGEIDEIDIEIEKFHKTTGREKCLMFQKLKKLIVKMNMDEQSKTLSEYEQKTHKIEKIECSSIKK